MEFTIYEHIPAGDLLLELAPEIVIENDRSQYIKFMTIAEDFFIANSLICADSTIFDNERPTTYNYTVYCDDALARAKQLAKLVFEADSTGLARYTAVIPKIPDHMYVVTVNTRELFVFINTKFGHHKRFDEIVQTITKKALFTKKEIKCLEPLAQLTDIYTRLTDAAEVDEWPNYLKKEEILRPYLHNEEYISRTTSVHITPSSSKHHESKKKNKNTFVCDFLSSIDNKVIIGNTAINILTGNKSTIKKLQIVSSNFEQDKKFLLTNMSRYNIYIKHEFPKLIGDERHIKLLVYKKINDEHIPIVEMYNAGDFTMIPYNVVNNYDLFADSKNAIDSNDDDIWLHELIKHKDLKVGTAFTIMRFATYSMWQDKCSMYFMDADKEELKQQIIETLDTYFMAEKILNDIYQEINTTTDKKQAIEKILPSRKYMGHYTKLISELKRGFTKKDIYKMAKIHPLYIELHK